MNSDKPGFARRLAAVAIPLLIVGTGIFAARALTATAPRPERTERAEQARLVEIYAVSATDTRVVVEAMGQAGAAATVELRAQVGGEVVELGAGVVPGGVFHQGDLLVSIEPRDYELEVRRRRSEVAATERDLKLEMGRQAVALREFELLGEVVGDDESELVLRRPQLLAARQMLDAARAQLEDAELDLSRAVVTAPFNAYVRDKHVDVGDVVTTATALVTLVGTDEAWIELALPVDELRWLDIPRSVGERGSVVRI